MNRLVSLFDQKAANYDLTAEEVASWTKLLAPLKPLTTEEKVEIAMLEKQQQEKEKRIALGLEFVYSDTDKINR